MTSKRTADVELTKYSDGLDNDHAINNAIAVAWASLLADKKNDVASELAVPAACLDAAKPPFRVETTSAGMSGTEVIVIFVSAALSEAVKDLGEAAAEALVKRVRKMWRSRMAKRLQDPKHPSLGDEVNDKPEE